MPMNVTFYEGVHRGKARDFVRKEIVYEEGGTVVDRPMTPDDAREFPLEWQKYQGPPKPKKKRK